jgi:hypothetical protein
MIKSYSFCPFKPDQFYCNELKAHPFIFVNLEKLVNFQYKGHAKGVNFESKALRKKHVQIFFLTP